MTRLAIVVSHPIQYYVPLYRRLAVRDDLDLKVFFTWHSADEPTPDRGFQRTFKWDIPLTEGYDWERVANTAADPGPHHFLGLRNPDLVARVLEWRPDAIHLTGYAGLSHLIALRAFRARAIPVLFRGDSHLLDASAHGPRWWLKRWLLTRVFSWPAAFLCVGTANRTYYEAFGVDRGRLFACPHSIEVARFADAALDAEAQARDWRTELGIPAEGKVLLFAGKFEAKKRPVALMAAVREHAPPGMVLVMVGDGEHGDEVRRIATGDPERFRVLPFQNQSRMPVVYRLGDLFVLPSAFGETWGLGVNEALACGRPALISSRVGCGADVIDDTCGRIFASEDWTDFGRALNELMRDPFLLTAMRSAATARARAFDIPVTETATMACLNRTLGREESAPQA